MTRGLMMTALFRITAKWVHKPHITAKSVAWRKCYAIYILCRNTPLSESNSICTCELTILCQDKLKIRENISKNSILRNNGKLTVRLSRYHILHLHFQKWCDDVAFLSLARQGKTILLGFTVSKNSCYNHMGALEFVYCRNRHFRRCFQWIRLTIILTVR